MGKRVLGWFAGIIVFFLVVGVAMTPLEEDAAAAQTGQISASTAVQDDFGSQGSAESSGLTAADPVLPESESGQLSASGSAESSAPAPGSETKMEAEEPEEQPDYILNINSGKFHDPSCPSVGLMNESNKRPFVGTREEAIAQGYEPCLNCDP